AGREVICTSVRRELLDDCATPGADADAVVSAFNGARLLRVNKSAAEGSVEVEVAHESMVFKWNRLMDWVEEARLDMRQRNRLTAAATQWRDNGRDSGALWGGSILAEAQSYSGLSPLETEFLKASGARQRLRRTLRGVAVGGAIVSLLVIATLVF